jgi:cytochrome oxidase Cu insertion factor (SCO1/SenC/PrrC family)
VDGVVNSDMPRLASIAIVVVAGVSVALLPVLAERPPARPISPIDYQAYTSNALREHFPNVPLVTQDKRTVRFYDDLIKNKVLIIQFMFTNCEQYCLMVTPNLVRVQTALQKRAAGRVTMISITVDPVHDTPGVLKEYASKFHVRPGWQFLTGQKSDIDQIRRGLGVYDPDDKKIEHMNVLTIGKESSGQWLAIGGLAKPEVIVQTVLSLTEHSARRTADQAGSRLTNH